MNLTGWRGTFSGGAEVRVSLRSQNLNWFEHRNDPDNWVVIPEFHVLPAAVSYAGFQCPILGPKSVDFLWKIPVFETLRTVRDEARARYATLAELKRHLYTALDSDDLMLDSEAPVAWSSDQVFAYRYDTFHQYILSSVRAHGSRQMLALSSLAHAMQTAADLFRTKAPDVREVRKEMGRAGAMRKLATDPKQQAKLKVKEHWQHWQKFPARYEGPTAFARNMLEQYEDLESQDVVMRWCRAWAKATQAP